MLLGRWGLAWTLTQAVLCNTRPFIQTMRVRNGREESGLGLRDCLPVVGFNNTGDEWEPEDGKNKGIEREMVRESGIKALKLETFCKILDTRERARWGRHWRWVFSKDGAEAWLEAFCPQRSSWSLGLFLGSSGGNVEMWLPKGSLRVTGTCARMELGRKL